jgi:hypothetical protein
MRPDSARGAISHQGSFRWRPRLEDEQNLLPSGLPWYEGRARRFKTLLSFAHHRRVSAK